jgi:hypothetical protein
VIQSVVQIGTVLLTVPVNMFGPISVEVMQTVVIRLDKSVTDKQAGYLQSFQIYNARNGRRFLGLTAT